MFGYIFDDYKGDNVEMGKHGMTKGIERDGGSCDLNLQNDIEFQ